MVKVKQPFLYLPDGDIDLDSWLNKINAEYQLKTVDLIRHASTLAQHTSKGLTTFYGQPCIEQSLEMAEILLALNLDQDAIAAAIVTSTIQHANLSIETIKKELGDSVATLVNGVLQMNSLNQFQANFNKARNPTQIDRLRKIFLAIASDIRVVLIKLAERTCIMRGIKNINPTERKRIAQETMDIYAPLANRLGIGQLKWELEDMSFHYTNPDKYKEIASFLAERRADREKRIHDTIARLKETLAKENVSAEITGRAKHIYSIYLKMQRKDVQHTNIYDYSAIRILVPTLADCYTTLSIVHQLFEHIPKEFDDYISKPKSNGYRSIHTAVIGPDEKNLEIQIRTHDMHNAAEHGVAAHWLYKEAKPHHEGYEDKITLLRNLIAWHKETAQNDLAPQKNIDEILEDSVYVFTPAGDIIDLPIDSTPLDFAYHIHSELGHRCRGAKIKGHIVPLTYHLRTGDQVEIITTPHGAPSRDWLNKDLGYLRTTRARNKVANWFKQQDIPEKEAPRPEIKHHHAEKVPALLPTKLQLSPEAGLQIDGIDDLLTRIARCCKPIPGDNVVGYITQGRGVSIHRKDCNNITSYLTEQNHRLIHVAWDSKKPGSYYVDLKIYAAKGHELLKEITSLLATAKIHLITLHSTISKKSNMIYILMTIQIHDIAQLNQLIHQMKQLPEVIDVKRLSEPGKK